MQNNIPTVHLFSYVCCMKCDTFCLVMAGFGFVSSFEKQKKKKTLWDSSTPRPDHWPPPTHSPPLPQLLLMHPRYTPTQSVSIIAPSETDTDNWSQIFLGRTQRDLLFTPKQLSTSHSPIPPRCKLRPSRRRQSRQSRATPRSQHSPFHCHGEAIGTHASRDPDPEPPHEPPRAPGLQWHLQDLPVCGHFSLIEVVPLISHIHWPLLMHLYTRHVCLKTCPWQ